MKLFLPILFFSCSSFAYNCSVDLPSGAVYFGQCYDQGNEVIFRSCVDFNCKVSKDKAKKLKKGSGCGANMTDSKLKALVESENSEIKSCGENI